MTRSQLCLFALIGCTSSAVAGIWAAEASSAPRSARAMNDVEWADYPSARGLSVSESLRLDGRTRDLAQFSTRDDPSDVVDYFEKFWRSQGFRVQRYFNHDEFAAVARSESEERTVVASADGLRASVVLSRRVVTDEAYRVDDRVENECKPLHHTSGADRGVYREIIMVRCTIDGAALLERYLSKWGEPRERLTDGRRYFARVSSPGADRSIAVYSDNLADAPVSFATIRQEFTR